MYPQTLFKLSMTSRERYDIKNLFFYFHFSPTVSNRTAEDEEREKDLLKKLVEIVEEKSDIVENLNKDTSW